MSRRNSAWVVVDIPAYWGWVQLSTIEVDREVLYNTITLCPVLPDKTQYRPDWTNLKSLCLVIPDNNFKTFYPVYHTNKITDPTNIFSTIDFIDFLVKFDVYMQHKLNIIFPIHLCAVPINQSIEWSNFYEQMFKEIDKWQQKMPFFLFCIILFLPVR